MAARAGQHCAISAIVRPRAQLWARLCPYAHLLRKVCASAMVSYNRACFGAACRRRVDGKSSQPLGVGLTIVGFFVQSLISSVLLTHVPTDTKRSAEHRAATAPLQMSHGTWTLV